MKAVLAINSVFVNYTVIHSKIKRRLNVIMTNSVILSFLPTPLNHYILYTPEEKFTFIKAT